MNRIHVADIFHLGSTQLKWANLSFAPFALNFTYVKVKVEKIRLQLLKFIALSTRAQFFFLRLITP